MQPPPTASGDPGSKEAAGATPAQLPCTARVQQGWRGTPNGFYVLLQFLIALQAKQAIMQKHHVCLLAGKAASMTESREWLGISSIPHCHTALGITV